MCSSDLDVLHWNCDLLSLPDHQLLPPDGELGLIRDEDGTEFHTASFPLSEGLTLLRDMDFVVLAEGINLVLFNG